MNLRYLRKPIHLAMLLLLLAAIMAAPVAAQGPGDEVEIAVSFHNGFNITPNPQVVPTGGVASMEFGVTDVEDLFSVNVAFDYNPNVVTVKGIKAGSLFDGLTPGVDYLVFPSVTNSVVHPGEPPIVFPNVRTRVNIAVINHFHPLVPIRGNGSLIQIDWKGGPGGATPVIFQYAKLTDEYGNQIEPCIFSLVCAPNPPDAPHAPNPVLVGFLTIGVPTPGTHVEFQVGSQGNRPVTVAPAPLPVVVTSSTPGPVAFIGPDRFMAPCLPAPCTITINRHGYLSATTTTATPSDGLGRVVLLAGDLNDDDIVNIFDITLIAGNLNLAPIDLAYDYNADGIVSIADLALVAKNFGLAGPRLID